MVRVRYFYHSFPRPRRGESREETVNRGWSILQSMRSIGLILAPEIVEWRTPVSIGSPSPIRLLQQRICFTELSPDELGAHSTRFGPFSIEFDVMTLRRAGALPVVYMPQALSRQDHLALLGPIIVSHLGHIKYTIEQLEFLNRFNDPSYVKNQFPEAERMSPDCVLTLTNGDQSRGTLQEFQVPWRAIRDLLGYLGFENAPYDAMTGVTSVVQSLFYPTDDEHSDDLLGYYRQNEWRITGGYYINGVPRARSLEEDEKLSLAELDSAFWKRELSDGKGGFFRANKALVLSESDRLLKTVRRLYVPEEKAQEARRIFGERVTIADWHAK